MLELGAVSPSAGTVARATAVAAARLGGVGAGSEAGEAAAAVTLAFAGNSSGEVSAWTVPPVSSSSSSSSSPPSSPQRLFAAKACPTSSVECLALLRPPSSSSVPSSSSSLSSSLLPAPLPLVLVGSGDGRLIALDANNNNNNNNYNEEEEESSGFIVGSCQAHADSLSCCSLVPSGPCSSTLVTASWDGRVKLWALAEGREPWKTEEVKKKKQNEASSSSSSSTNPVPFLELAGDEPVWSLACSAHDGGKLVLTGSDDGVVRAWDARAGGGGRRSSGSGSSSFTSSSSPVCTVRVSNDYVAGLALLPPSSCPGGVFAVAATADGGLSAVDFRQGRVVAQSGSRSSTSSSSSLSSSAVGPLRSLVCDGSLAIAGGEDGRVAFWPVREALLSRSGSGSGTGGESVPPPPLLAARSGVSINALAGLGGGAGRDALFVAGEDGRVTVLRG